MKFLMKKEPSAPLPGVAYGIGHGGMEMITIFGLTMISNLVLAIMINSGHADALFSQVPGDATTQVQTQLEQLQATGAATWLIGLWERISALILHLGLSMMVWVAVRKGGKWLWLFPAAILRHAMVDAGAGMLHKAVGIVALEFIVMGQAVAVAAIGYMLAKKL